MKDTLEATKAFASKVRSRKSVCLLENDERRPDSLSSRLSYWRFVKTFPGRCIMKTVNTAQRSSSRWTVFENQHDKTTLGGKKRAANSKILQPALVVFVACHTAVLEAWVVLSFRQRPLHGGKSAAGGQNSFEDNMESGWLKFWLENSRGGGKSDLIYGNFDCVQKTPTGNLQTRPCPKLTSVFWCRAC